MPLRIRCPHCHRVLIVKDEAAGEVKECPACKQKFNVPLPSAVVRAPQPPPPTSRHQCPRCKSETAPTATYCHRCHTDLRTGRRLPLMQRLRLFSGGFWTGVGLVTVVLILVVIAGVRIYRIRAAPPTATPPTPAASRPTSGTDSATTLFAARTLAERHAALRALARLEPQVATHVAEALAASLTTADRSPATQANRAAAIDLLARCIYAHPDRVPEWRTLLEQCQAHPALTESAIRARALLGDAQVRDALAELWLRSVERLLFLKRLIRVTARTDDPVARLALREAQSEVTRFGAGLRALAQNPDHGVFLELADAYWSSWEWLGQEAGDLLADELFELAGPQVAALEFRPEDVRQARDVLKRIAEHASHAARAAAGLILDRRGPQYHSLANQICDTLAALLPESNPVDQQRLTWTISRMQGRLFSPELRAHPWDVTPAEIANALAWARPGTTAAPPTDYPRPPRLTYRAITPERRTERALLQDLGSDWPTATAAIDRWRAAGLGLTAGLRAVLHPGQRRPHYPALAAGFVIVAESQDDSLTHALELWREAADQPAWVRALAACTLASLPHQRGRGPAPWLPLLAEVDAGQLDRGTPGWEHFGRVLAAGGPDLRAALEAEGPDAPPRPFRTKLLQAVRSARGDPRPDERP